MTEVAKLTERIDNLIERVGDLKGDFKNEATETRNKIGQIEKSISSFTGGIKVLGGLFTLALVVIGAVLAWLLRPSPTPPAPANPMVASPEPAGVLTNTQTKGAAPKATPD